MLVYLSLSIHFNIKFLFEGHESILPQIKYVLLRKKKDMWKKTVGFFLRIKQQTKFFYQKNFRPPPSRDGRTDPPAATDVVLARRGERAEGKNSERISSEKSRIKFLQNLSKKIENLLRKFSSLLEFSYRTTPPKDFKYPKGYLKQRFVFDKTSDE